MSLDKLFAVELAPIGEWDLRLSIAVPTEWPLTSTTAFVTYAAALRMGPSPTVFEYTALLAKATHWLGATKALSFERLGPLEAKSFTGVQPISGSELRAISELPSPNELYAALGKGKTAPELATALRAQWGFFRKTHIYLHAQIEPLHRPFFGWLAAT